MFLTGCWSGNKLARLLCLDLAFEDAIAEPDDEILTRLTDFRTDKVAFLIKTSLFRVSKWLKFSVDINFLF